MGTEKSTIKLTRKEIMQNSYQSLQAQFAHSSSLRIVTSVLKEVNNHVYFRFGEKGNQEMVSFSGCWVHWPNDVFSYDHCWKKLMTKCTLDGLTQVWLVSMVAGSICPIASAAGHSGGPRLFLLLIACYLLVASVCTVVPWYWYLVLWYRGKF